MNYVIVNTDPLDSFDGFAPTFWSNEFGWTSIEDADTFTNEEKREFNTPDSGVWAESRDVDYFRSDDLGTYAKSRPCKCPGQCEATA